MNKKYLAAIFDLDGTLIDSLEDIARAANMALAKCALPQHPLEAYRYYVGAGVQVLVKRMVPESTPEEKINALVMSFKEIYREGWNIHTVPYPGITQMLDKLTAIGIKLAVLSNKPDEFTQKCMLEFFKTYRFDQVFGQRDNVPRKPEPQGALEIADNLGIDPAASLFVGDTSVDMQTAKRAGMTAVGVSWGFRDIEELQAAGADIIIDNPEQLLSYFTTHD